MSSDPIDKFFKTKYEFLDEFIRNTDVMSNMLGQSSKDRAMMIHHGNVLRNIKELYFIQEVTMKTILGIRNELSDLHKQAGTAEETAKQLTDRFDTTLGSLEDRLKKINEKDDEERKKLGEVSFYG